MSVVKKMHDRLVYGRRMQLLAGQINALESGRKRRARVAGRLVFFRCLWVSCCSSYGSWPASRSWQLDVSAVS
jgi:hypothetical protein